MPIDQLLQLKERDPDVAAMLDFYAESDRIYRDALEAMGFMTPQTCEPQNSSTAALSFAGTASTANANAFGEHIV